MKIKRKNAAGESRFWFVMLKGRHIAVIAAGLLTLTIACGSVQTARLTCARVNVPDAKLAIIIDDFGRQRRGVKEMLALDCKLTVAVMPFLEYSHEDAENAKRSGKEVIIHLPMQSTLHDNWNYVGPKPFKISQSEAEINALLDEMLTDIPQASGANIHMGAISSTKIEMMRPIFRRLRDNNLFFVDSKTSGKSVCRAAAEETGIRFYENRVFLEHEQKTREYVKNRLQKAMNIAKEQGQCIAIGHVGNEGGMITVEAIDEMRGEFEENGVELVWVSELAPELLTD